jgi:hypothetical protein
MSSAGKPSPKTHNGAADLAFVSVIAWPNEFSVEGTVARMAAASGLDEPTMQFQARKTAPAILARVPLVTAQRALAALIECGGECFCPTIKQIEALGPTIKIKDVALQNGSFIIELWRGKPLTIKPEQFAVLVRARLSETRLQPTPIPGTLMTDFLGVTTTSLPMGYGGAYGLAATFALAEDTAIQSYIESQKIITISNKLDLHTTNGRVFQIDGDKFGFRILGEQRGSSDNVNIDRMCELVAHLSPDAIVDPYYSLWKPPTGAKQIRLPGMLVNNDDPAFAFYSRWVALMYRHMLSSQHDS